MKKRIFMQFPFMGKDGKECENNEWFPECPGGRNVAADGNNCYSLLFLSRWITCRFPLLEETEIRIFFRKGIPIETFRARMPVFLPCRVIRHGFPPPISCTARTIVLQASGTWMPDFSVPSCPWCRTPAKGLGWGPPAWIDLSGPPGFSDVPRR